MADQQSMGVVSNDVLESLEKLMMEFFSPTTGNNRKREIEEMLKSFDKQPNSWKYCLCFIEKSNNQFVSMFGLTTIENIIIRRWSTLTSSEKHELRHALWQCLLSSYPKSPPFIRNKLAKSIIDIARFDWPTLYPSFFNDMLQLTKCGGKLQTLGILLVHAFAEGFGHNGADSPNSLLSQDRRQELNQLLLQCVPELFTLLIDILDKLASEKSLDSAPIGTQLNESQPSNIRISENNQDYEECVKICLATIQQLLSCLPQASRMPPTILTLLFHWTNSTIYNEDINIACMSVINELLYQRRINNNSEAFSILSLETFKLLQYITTPLQRPIVANFSPIYVDKISEYLQLFVSQYFKKLEIEVDFNPIEFLLFLFHYTFQVPTCANFINCLEIWIHFADGLKPQDSVRYSDALLGLVSATINKIQFQHNSTQLEQLDNLSTNDDGETEWQIFLRHCIESIAKVAEFAPLHIFKLIQNIWQELADAHDSGAIVEQQLFDLTSLTQLLGRLAPTLFQERDDSIPDQCTYQASIFLERVLKILNCANNMYNNKNNEERKPLKHAYINVYAGILACLGSWTHYMPRCHLPDNTIPILLQIGSSILLNKNEQNSPVLCHAAAHMMLSISVSIKPSDPLQHISDLFLQAQLSLEHLQFKTAAVVRQALCMMILECPMEHTANIDAKRLQACALLIEAWCSSLLTTSAGNSPARQLSCLPALTQLLNYFNDHPTQTKKILATAIEKPVQAALEVFQNCYHEIDYKDSNVASLILNLFLSLLHTLHQQLGNVFIRNSIHLFLEIAKRKQQGALQQLMQVLKAAVESGALSNTVALEEVLSMSIEHILPIAQGSNADIDIVYALFDLFGSILLNRWQHFYSSCVRQGWSPVSPEGASDGAKINNLPHFRAVMFAIAESLHTDNIEVVRLNLKTLDCLNIRYKLYNKVAFRQELLPHTLGILLKLLIYRTAVGTLLQEEICTTCYNLAAIDFPVYFESFLPSFLMTIPQLINEEVQFLCLPKDIDLPTFTQNLIQMALNIRCYQTAREPV